MQEQKNKRQIKVCKKRVIADNKQWQQNISRSAQHLAKREPIMIRAMQMKLLDRRLKSLRGYDEVMLHLIPRMNKKPQLLR